MGDKTHTHTHTRIHTQKASKEVGELAVLRTIDALRKEYVMSLHTMQPEY